MNQVRKIVDFIFYFVVNLSVLSTLYRPIASHKRWIAKVYHHFEVRYTCTQDNPTICTQLTVDNYQGNCVIMLLYDNLLSIKE